MTAAPRVRPAAVLWDMDGTIVDTEPYWIECEYELVREHGGHWDQRKAHSVVGLDLRETARILQEQGSVDLPIDDIVNRLLDGVIERVRRRVPWRPGARELLAALRDAGIPCALVTMSWTRFADAVVEALPPDSFDAVITGDMVRRGKPHPEPYLAAAAALGVDPRRCIAIEDSPTGARSAASAGCRTIAVPNVVDVPDIDGVQRIPSLDGADPAMFGLRGRRRPRRRPLAVLAALVALATLAAVVIRRDEPPLPVIPMSGWAPYWVLDSAAGTIDAEGSHFTELSPFWFEARSATDVGLVATLDEAEVGRFLDTVRSSGALVVPAVVDVMPANGMASVLADDAARQRHVATLLDLAESWDADGLDIDYERFAFDDARSTWATTAVDWITFLGELGAGLRAEGRILTVAVPPIYDTARTADSGYWVYDYAAMGDVVDRIRIMAYDYSVGDPGPIAPLDWIRTAVRAAKEAVDDDAKVVLGIPLYGRNWVIGTDGTCPDDTPGRVDPNLREIDQLLERYGATTTYDPLTGDEWFEYSRESTDGVTTCVQRRRVHFVGPRGARERVDIARRERIGGVAFWALGFDTPAVWDAVRSLALDPVAP
ncbi:MAG: HAD-IA family hydrolase [Ilumatobacteraceae bacterium]